MIHIHKWKLISKKEKYCKVENYGTIKGYETLTVYQCSKCGKIKKKKGWKLEDK